MVDAKQIEDAADDGIDKTVYGFRSVVKSGRGGANGTTGPCDFEHIFQVDGCKGRLPMHQY